MNCCILSGNLGANVTIGKTEKGQTIAKTSMYVRCNHSTDGEWHNLVAFDKTAEHMARFCKKGTTVTVYGEISPNKYTMNGETHYNPQLIVNQFEVTARGQNEKEGSSDAEGKKRSKVKSTS